MIEFNSWSHFPTNWPNTIMTSHWWCVEPWSMQYDFLSFLAILIHFTGDLREFYIISYDTWGCSLISCPIFVGSSVWLLPSTTAHAAPHRRVTLGSWESAAGRPCHPVIHGKRNGWNMVTIQINHVCNTYTYIYIYFRCIIGIIYEKTILDSMSAFYNKIQYELLLHLCSYFWHDSTMKANEDYIMEETNQTSNQVKMTEQQQKKVPNAFKQIMNLKLMFLSRFFQATTITSTSTSSYISSQNLRAFFRKPDRSLAPRVRARPSNSVRLGVRPLAKTSRLTWWQRWQVGIERILTTSENKHQNELMKIDEGLK